MAEQINVNEFRPGITFIHEGDVHIVLDSTHSKSGRGQAHVKCKTKNLFTNVTSLITFTGGEKVEKAFVSKSKMQFLYIDGENAIFMNTETFEQLEIKLKKLEEELQYITEGSEVMVINYESRILGIEIPKNVELKVIEAADAVKGDTVTNATKKIKLETGIEIDAPQFIKEGQTIIVNTSNGKYGGKI
ncbi:MAG: elongation factor P [Candidatus Tyloplasma litorale]|nr:MAG: elongation factor P [Mycoplasmatales bacterium]